MVLLAQEEVFTKLMYICIRMSACLDAALEGKLIDPFPAKSQETYQLGHVDAVRLQRAIVSVIN